MQISLLLMEEIMTSVLQALAAKQIEVETRKQQSHEQKSRRKHYEFSL